MKGRHYTDVAKTAAIIGNQEQLTDNYKIVRGLLFSMYQELRRNNLAVTSDMRHNLILLHRYHAIEDVQLQKQYERDDANLDLRQFQSKKLVAAFKHHTNHITPVEWNPEDSTLLASGGDDDQIALWDSAVEKDDETTPAQSQNHNELENLPPQLLFIHQRQKEIKELHWHPQLPPSSTAHSGFNIFRTTSVSNDY
ncbi:hypothetical protein GQX74_011082 [Glossina fuscipes]|nr:hypothetical protein GQX74_011082 [Glossina fuscipes]